MTYSFDPSCPWTWLTSRWLVGVAGREGFDVEWRAFSLPYVNRDKDLPEEWRPRMEVVTGAHRALQALRERGDNDAVGRLYGALGARWHTGGEELTRESVLAAARDAGVEDVAAPALDDASLDAAVAASTDAALALAGPDIGSPVLGIDGAGVNGPIIRALPDDAGSQRLWEAVQAVVSLREWHELKRGRTGPPEVRSSS